MISGFNPEQEVVRIEMLYKLLCRSEPYQRWFLEYRRRNNDAVFMLQMEDGIRNWIRAQFERAAESMRNAPTDEEFLRVVNEAKELRRNYGEYGQAIESLEDVFDIDGKYRAPIFLSFWLKYCNIYRDTVRMITAGGLGPIHPEIDVGDDVPGITVIEDQPAPEESEGPEPSDGGDFTRHRRNVWDIILSWNEIEQLSRDEKNKWLAEVLKMFDWLRGQTNFMAVMRDDHFSPEEKLAEYNKQLVAYKFQLMRRSDFAKAALFKKMLDDNAAQFLDIFAEGVEEADAQGVQFYVDDSEYAEMSLGSLDNSIYEYQEAAGKGDSVTKKADGYEAAK